MNEFIVTINSKKKTIKTSGNGSVVFNDKKYYAGISKISNQSFLLKLNDSIYDITVHKLNNERYGFLIDGHYYETTVRTQLQEKANEFLSLKEKQSHHDVLKAPMPGLVLKVKKKVGDDVEIGESVVILEAMKMENDIRSPASGIIKEIKVTEGNSVEKGEILISIE